jgi:hypothetical protein
VCTVVLEQNAPPIKNSDYITSLGSLDFEDCDKRSVYYSNLGRFHYYNCDYESGTLAMIKSLHARLESCGYSAILHEEDVEIGSLWESVRSR